MGQMNSANSQLRWSLRYGKSHAQQQQQQHKVGRYIVVRLEVQVLT